LLLAAGLPPVLLDGAQMQAVAMQFRGYGRPA